jgi:glycosyltransferase involved in cell wall biosynthesis
VLAAGGYLDTVIDGETGICFAAPEPDAIAAAVTRMDASSWDADRLRAHAGRFSLARFEARLRDVVTDVAGAAR